MTVQSSHTLLFTDYDRIKDELIRVGDRIQVLLVEVVPPRTIAIAYGVKVVTLDADRKMFQKNGEVLHPQHYLVLPYMEEHSKNAVEVKGGTLRFLIYRDVGSIRRDDLKHLLELRDACS